MIVVTSYNTKSYSISIIKNEVIISWYTQGYMKEMIFLCALKSNGIWEVWSFYRVTIVYWVGRLFTRLQLSMIIMFATYQWQLHLAKEQFRR